MTTAAGAGGAEETRTRSQASGCLTRSKRCAPEEGEGVLRNAETAVSHSLSARGLTVRAPARAPLWL